MEEKKEKKKLSYEQLEAYANNLTIQAEKIYKENNELKEELKGLRNQLMNTGLTFAFKVVENKESFNKEFVQTIVNKIEELLSPKENKEEDKTKE